MEPERNLPARHELSGCIRGANASAQRMQANGAGGRLDDPAS